MDSLENLLEEQIGDNNFCEVSLDDTIEVGCNHCGRCCVSETNQMLNAYDMYLLRKHYNDKDIIKMVSMSIGENSYLPVLSIKMNDYSKQCPLLKLNNEGDFECALGDDKPTICKVGTFIALTNKLNGEMFKFVPFDEEVPDIDIDKILDDFSIRNNKLFFVVGRKETCGAETHPIVVRDLIKDRIACNKEANLARMLVLLSKRYFDLKELVKLLTLAERSNCNILKGFIKSKDEDSGLQKVLRMLFSVTYLYPDPDKDFVEQTIEQLKHVQHSSYKKIRSLTKFLFKIFEFDKEAFKEIMNTEDETLAQQRFDEYYKNNAGEISVRFLKCASDLMKELEGVL